MRAILAVLSLCCSAGRRRPSAATQAQRLRSRVRLPADPGRGGTPGASCGLSVTTATAGPIITATITNVAVGSPVQITVQRRHRRPRASPARARPTSSSSAPLANGRRRAQATTTSLQLTFPVPSVAVGTYQVFAVGPGSPAACAVGGFSVLGTSLTSTGSEGGRGLASTGIESRAVLGARARAVVAGYSRSSTPGGAAVGPP